MSFLKRWMQVFGILVVFVLAACAGVMLFTYLIDHSVVATIAFVLLLLSGFIASILETIQ